MHSALGQSLIDAHDSDSVETAEAIWAAARSRDLGDLVLEGLKLPASVPARVWLERRRLEAAERTHEAAAGGCGSDCSDCGGSDCCEQSVRGGGGGGGGGGGSSNCSSSCDGRSSRSVAAAAGAPAQQQHNILRRWFSSLLSVGSSGGGGGSSKHSHNSNTTSSCTEVDDSLPDPPLSHILACLEGVHGAAALHGAKMMLASTATARGSSSCGGSSSDGESWLTLRSLSALSLGNGAACDSAALGEAVVAAAEGDSCRLQQLQQQEQRQRQWWVQQQWQRMQWAPQRQEHHHHGGGSSASSSCSNGAGDSAGGVTSRMTSTAAAFPSPGSIGYDKLLVTAAKHGRTAVLRQLLQPLLALPPVQLQTRGVLLMGIALQRRQLDLIWLLIEHGLACNASEGYRLLQVRPASMTDEEKGAGAEGAARAGVGDVEGDAAAAVALLSAAEEGSRDERLLHTWLLAAVHAAAAAAHDAPAGGGSTAGGTPLCGRRAAAVLRAVARAAPGALPVGARAAAPRALLQRAALPAADVELIQAMFDWVDRDDVTLIA